MSHALKKFLSADSSRIGSRRFPSRPLSRLTIYPRSGLGFKYRFQLDNSVGVIDSDYARSDNEGHIFMRMTNDNREGKSLIVPSGTAFAQGIFLPFGITVDDHAQGVRNGGLGSTTGR